MRTRLLSTALLALAGATTSLAAQTRTPRPAPERDATRPRARTLLSRIGLDPERPRLGIAIETTGAGDTLGVLVSEVTEGGPAEKAGMKEGDRLTAIDGVNLKLNTADAEDETLRGITQRRLTRELGKHKAGDDVTIRLNRDGKAMTLTVKTVAAEELEPRLAIAAGARGMRGNPDRATLGVGLGGSASKRDTLGILVASLTSEGPAEQSGLEEGDRIAAINGVDLRVPREDVGDWAASSARVRRLSRELEKVKAGDTVELRVYRAGQPRTVKVKTAAARDVERGARQMFIIGDGAGMNGFDFSMPAVPPVPPTAPLEPLAPMPPLPPSAPRLYWFDGEGNGDVRLRVSPRGRVELRELTRDALERALERVPRAFDLAPLDLDVEPRVRHRIRLETDGPDAPDVSDPSTPRIRVRTTKVEATP